MKKVALFLLFAFSFAHARTEFGKLAGAEYRIDVPDDWNHGLVVFLHGYDLRPEGVPFERGKPLDGWMTVFYQAGYAVAQSGYSRGGWALEQAVPETEELRKYFIQKYGPPKETYASGASMGGRLTTILIEKFPQTYDAGLALCGALGPATSLMQHGFDLGVIFEYYFPGVLPSPARVPANYQASDELVKKIIHLLQSKPAASAVLRRMSGSRTNVELANSLAFLTYVMKDIQQRAGGNPFDNRNTIYTGTLNDDVLNDRIKRYAADPGALDYVERTYPVNGHLTRPVLAIHTTRDQLVSPSYPAAYDMMVREADAGDFFVQQYVKREGHCNFTPADIEKGFGELRAWKDSGKRPQPGWLH
jgi:pimeloyl-ACP methyl ester carboxylesterase